MTVDSDICLNPFRKIYIKKRSSKIKRTQGCTMKDIVCTRGVNSDRESEGILDAGNVKLRRQMYVWIERVKVRQFAGDCF